VRLTKRTHPATGEVCYQHVDRSPPVQLQAREVHGVHGDPFLDLLVCADRVEIHRGWCFSSGHMEHYEEEVELVVRRQPDGWPGSLRSALAERFGEEVASAVEAALADEAAFGPRPDSPGAERMGG